MSDLEEGEIENDDESTDAGSVATKSEYSMLETKATNSFAERPKLVPHYRNSKRTSNSSESDSSGEEDTTLWRQKKEKYFRKYKDGTPPHCPSPTLPEFVPTSNNSNSSSLSNKKRNNIWGSVLTEQTLTHALVQGTGLNRLYEDKCERTVESYDFTNKYKDTRPIVMPEDDKEEVKTNDPFEKVLSSTIVKSRGREIIGYDDTLLDKGKKNNRKRKMDCSDSKSGVHSRLGPKKAATMQVGGCNVSEDMNVKELAKNISEYIHEPKVELIERVAEHMGKAAAIRVLNQTRDIEDSGGMLTVDGSRRRTPGGVYLQMLKQQPEYNKDMYKLIFSEDHAWKTEQKSRQKQRKRARSKLRKQAKTAANKQSGADAADKPQEETMEDGENHTHTKSHAEQMECGERNLQGTQSRKSRSSSQNGRMGDRVKSADSGSGSVEPRTRRSRSYSDHDTDSDDSDDDYSGSKPTGEFDFQAELAAAKQQIAKEKDKSSKEVEAEMDDLDEANVIDIPLEG